LLNTLTTSVPYHFIDAKIWLIHLSSYLKKANNDQENIVGAVTPLDKLGLVFILKSQS